MGVDDHYVIKDGKPRHSRHNAQAGLDVTTFLLAEDFMDVVDDYDLAYRHLEVERTVGDRIYESEYHIWARRDVLLVTTGNPLLPDADPIFDADDRAGSAGLIGIEGEQDTVQALFDDLRDAAVSIKNENPSSRPYV